MSARKTWALGAAALALVPACSVFYDLDGYDSGSSGSMTTTAATGGSSSASSGSGGSTGSPYRDAVVADAPLSYWRFGEASGVVAKDEMGRHDGQYQEVDLGGPGALDGDGDTAGHFNGAGSAVVFGDVLDLVGGTAFTFEAWARPAVVDDKLRRLLTKQINTAGEEQGFSIVNSTANQFTFQTYADDKWAGEVTQAPLPAGRYTYVVVSYDTNTVRVYWDAVRQAETKIAIDLRDNGADFVIGSLSVPTGNFWSGDLDEIAIYDHELAPARIEAHFEAGRPKTR